MTPGTFLLIAALGTVIAIAGAGFPKRLWLPATLTSATAALVAALWVLFGAASWHWRPGQAIGGEPILLRLDGLSAFFLALIGVIGGVASLYSVEYWSDREHPKSARAGRIWWNLLLLAMALVVLESNGLHFLLVWELFTLASYFLITCQRHRREARAAGWLYLVASHAATLCLFAFFAALSTKTGSWELGPMRDRPELAPLFWLALVGFGLKAGLFPLHIWLPSAHANAPSHVSAILSGVAIKMGIYGLVRFSGWLAAPEAAGWVVAGLGVISSVLGVAFALGQHDLKRLLAYHSVENIGIMLIGLGFAMIASSQPGASWGGFALAGSLWHVWNHGLFKALLFLGAGSVQHATGTTVMSRLGGLWRTMPGTTALFALGAVAISGLPPLNGFVSEWLVYLGLFDAVAGSTPASWAAAVAAIALGVTGALALACFVKACGVVFLGSARTAAATSAHECGSAMRGAMIVLAAGCVATGLVPALFWPAIATASASWSTAWTGPASPPPLLALGHLHLLLAGLITVVAVGVWHQLRRNGIERAGTWDCGYAAPTPRMQYTAGSFAGIITEWFAWILRPRRRAQLPEGLFPARAEVHMHTPETVLEDVVEPAGSVVLRISTVVRRLQHGRLQAYVLYLVLGMIGLAVLVWATEGGG